MMYEQTLERFAVDADGRPLVESIVWRLQPYDPRAVPLGPFHDPSLMWYSDEPDPTDPEGTRRMQVVGPAPDAWLPISVSGGLFHLEAFEMGVSPYDLPLRDGLTSIDKPDWENLTATITAANAQAWSTFMADAPRLAQEAWDATAERYQRLGWDMADVVAELGARPGGV